MKLINHATVVAATILLPFAAAARPDHITGSVKESSGKSITAATVTLLRQADSSWVKTELTDASGAFVFNGVVDGQYLLKVTALGYEPRFQQVQLQGNQPSLATVTMEPRTSQLKQVTVTERKPFVEARLDKTIVNVEGAVTSAGSTALEVLEKSPGIMVDKDGNISMRGKQGVVVMIDGRPSYLSGADLANYLRSLSADQVAQLELITQPSAKYDAAGNAGIINIKTKKGRQSGLNGSVSLAYTQGVYPKASNTIQLNYKKNKINLYGSYNFSHWEGFSHHELDRNFRTGGNDVVTSNFNQNTSMRNVGNPHSLKAGVDYDVTQKTTIGLSVNGMFNTQQNDNNSLTKITDNVNQTISYNKAENRIHNPWSNGGFNAYMKHSFKQQGPELSADLDYMQYLANSNQLATNQPLDAGMVPVGVPLQLRGELPSDIRIYSAKVDYSHPFAKTWKFEAGAKSSYVTSDNDARYSVMDQNEWTYDSSRSNHFIYNENINAAYVNTATSIGKQWQAQVGLRLENTNAEGKQLANNQKFTRTYTQLFPTAYVSYQLNKNNQFSLNYGRRIDRPSYQDMNPFRYFLDQYAYQQGNPYLKPQFSNNVELAHVFKGVLITTARYSQTSDIINDILLQNDTTKVTFQTKDNVAKSTNYGVSVSFNYDLTKWWMLNAFGDLGYTHYQGVINNAPIDVEQTTFTININNQFRFKKGWSAELSGFYVSPQLETAMIYARQMGMVSVGVGKKILKDRGSLKLSVRDPFYTLKFSGYTRFDNIDLKVNSRWDNRQATIAFTYNFGKQQGQQRRRQSGASDEQKRVNMGGQQ
jgi:outer membrane receptor protein involved in Fe transport